MCNIFCIIVIIGTVISLTFLTEIGLDKTLKLVSEWIVKRTQR